MTDEKMTPEDGPTIDDQAIDYALRSGWSESGKQLDTAESHAIHRAYLAGDSNGYSRGKADAEKLIWDRIMKTRLDGPNGIMNLRQAIFGGGDDDK